MPEEPTIYAWFLHTEMLRALLRAKGGLGVRFWLDTRIRGEGEALCHRLDRWLEDHPVLALDQLRSLSDLEPGDIASAELPFTWSNVAQDLADLRAGDRHARSSFLASMWLSEHQRVEIHGSFNPRRLTCTTAYSELRGVRRQFVLGQVTSVDAVSIELRTIAIATRLPGAA